ncbi:hypothetical protein, partial [Yaniella flava]|uniref:hypothetical protein n=1 Tax=Yaniella flava TaxID=287930 RepID=UPI0031DF11B4
YPVVRPLFPEAQTAVTKYTLRTAVAEALIFTLEDASNRLRGQGPERRDAAEAGLVDFSGGYARLFRQACAAEAEDRGLLAGRLSELSDQVREAKLRAAEEKLRLQRMEQWHQQVADLDMSDGNDVVWPTRPSILPIAAPIFSTVFSAQQRTRVSMGGFGSAVSSVTSANPEHLRTYVGLAQACNAIMEDEYSNLEGALARFRSSCSWASLAGVNVLEGFSQLIEENDMDGRWVEQIAQAFEDAGGGVLSNLSVGVAVLGNHPADFAEVLLNADFTMEQTAEAWDAFVEHNDDSIVTTFVEQYSFELAALNGIPFHVQHYAGKHSLEYALGPKGNEFADGPLLQRRLEHAYSSHGISTRRYVACRVSNGTQPRSVSTESCGT